MRSVWCIGIQEEASSSSSTRKSEAQLLEEGLNKAIKQLLLALGMPKLATGDWQAIIQAGGTTDTGEWIDVTWYLSFLVPLGCFVQFIGFCDTSTWQP